MQNSKLKFIFAFLFATGYWLLASFSVRAEVAPGGSFCGGNICQSGAVALSGCGGKTSTLRYEYTQHAKPGGNFKVRFWNDAAVTSTCPLSYAVISDQFGALFDSASAGYVVRPLTSFSGTETLTPVAYKVEDGNGFTGTVDITLALGVMPSVAAGRYDVRFSAVENGQSFISPNTPVYIDASAPSNAIEKDPFPGVAGWAACADGLDNDLSYRHDCADQNCLGEIGNTACAVAEQCKCEAGEATCFDRFDNDFDLDGIAGGYTDASGDYDLETGADCRDLDCDGRQGDKDDVNQKCYFQNEHIGFSSSDSCGDFFNNDADDGNGVLTSLSQAYAGGQSGYRDCYDNNCWRTGTLSGDRCPAKETVTAGGCLDGVDNDFDDGINGKDSGVAGALDGGDCLDYDCAGTSFYNAASPDPKCVEVTPDFTNTENALSPKNCFDGVDNDLDAYVWNGSQYVLNSNAAAGLDCGDADCLGVENPDAPYQICVSSEFALYSHNYCANPPGYLATLTGGIDDDGDGPANCSDNDCRQKFGNCGVCPSQEFWKYDACADGLNNDFDGTADCQDTDCADKIGQLNGGAMCGAESTSAKCSDGFDNDADETTDCGDTDCTDKGVCGAESTPEKCADGIDNDADGEADCLDSQCAGVGECAAAFATVSCQSGGLWDPEYPPGALFVSGGTVRGAQTRRLYAGDSHRIRLVGTSTYSSVTVTLGNANVETQYFPYDSRTCVLENGGANFTLVADEDGHVLQMINQPVGNISSFDVTVRCPLPPDEAAGVLHVYPAVIDVARAVAGGDELESGELFWTTGLYENQAPTIAEIEVAGVLATGEVKIPYGGALQTRAVPQTDDSGVCGCDFWMGSAETCDPTNDVTCQKPSTPDCRLHAANQIYDVADYFIRARAEDGSGNQGNYGPNPARRINLNVTPIVKPGTKVSFSKTSPFYAPGENVAFSGAHFKGPQTTVYGDCELLLNGSVQGVSLIKEVAGAGEITCRGSMDAPATRGEHRLIVRTDGDGDSVSTPAAVFYVCPPGDTAPPCDKADFDGDGSPERTFTNKYGDIQLTCDNCPPGLVDEFGNPLPSYNPDQEDRNANGIGDMCEQSMIEEEDICEDAPWIACTAGGGECDANNGGACVENDLGLCGGNGKLCHINQNDCGVDAQGDPIPCVKVLPWIETRDGDVYSSGSIRASSPPPAGKFNATFCVLADGAVEQFSSGANCVRTGVGPQTQARAADASLVHISQGIVNRMDIAGLKAGRYGEVILHEPPAGGGMIEVGGDAFISALGGKVHVFSGDTEITSDIFVSNGPVGGRGSGLILVEGNLTVRANISYAAPFSTPSRELASLGVVAVKNPDGQGGNITINGAVENLAGAWLAEGEFATGASNKPLAVSGLLAAESFAFERVSANQQSGSEVISYDGRAVANPPPGMGDFVQALPIIRETVAP